MTAKPELPGLYFLGQPQRPEVGPNEVGAKAYNLLRLSEAGLPVPPGFVLGIALCRAFSEGVDLSADLSARLKAGVAELEKMTSAGFGGGRRPLLVSVRSGAARSMPGMLDTILNVGLTDSTVPEVLKATGDPVFVWDSYRRLIQSFGEVVEGCPPAAFDAVISEALLRADVPAIDELDVAEMQGLVSRMKAAYDETAGRPFPQDPMQQLQFAVQAVWRSWNSPRAVEYRRLGGLSDLTGTAVTVQQMVFGNRGMTSGSGVGFTRDPSTGDDRLYADFLLNAQGDDVVSGRRIAGDSTRAIAAVPELSERLRSVRRTLEAVFRDVQDFEFTVQEGRLWLLQTRSAKRTPLAALRFASEFVAEGVIDTTTALERLEGIDLEAITRMRLRADSPPPAARGIPAATGIASGRAVLSSDSAKRLAAEGHRVILVRHDTSTDDIAGLGICAGLVTVTGARTSHAAVVARQLGVAAVVGCSQLGVDPENGTFHIGAVALAEGAPITVDGDDGTVYASEVPVITERPDELLAEVDSWRKAAQG